METLKTHPGLWMMAEHSPQGVMFNMAGTSCSSASQKEINGGGKTAPATLPSSDKTGSTLPAILLLNFFNFQIKEMTEEQESSI